MERIWSIQYLRALAALGVVVFHALESSPYRFEIGQAGVDVFFVISGFIMASLMLGREGDPLTFAWRRLVRIVPLYWATTFAALVVAWLKPSFFYRMDASLENAALSMLFIPHTSAAGGVSPVLWQGWTLEYEMFFYLLCALALLLPSRRLVALGAALVALVVVGLVVQPAGPIALAYTNPLLLEFGAGVLLALAWRQRWLRAFWLGAGALAAGVGVYALQQAGLAPVTGARIIDWGVPALLIVAGALAMEGGGRMPRSRFGLLVGDASYSLYLTHGFAVSGFLWFFPETPLPLRVAACVIGAVTAAIATYLLFEKPVTEFLKRLGLRRASA
jgi:exopolysaccharide production protein ExoZ